MANSSDKFNNRGIKLPFDFTKDKLALLVGAMAVIALIFATYNFFNKGSDISATSTENEDKVVLKNNDKNSKPDDSTKSDDTTKTTSNQEVWTATNYEQGDISGSSYTVKSGDTLWEIAEAVYGDGSQWTKLLDANKSSIGFLPNGRQALIVPGQVLVLP